MSILVTGGAGFLGSHLLERLYSETSETLICFDNFNDYYDPAKKHRNLNNLKNQPRFQLIEGDLCNPASLKNLFETHSIEHVFHFAACAGVRPSLKDPLMYERVNVEGTLHLLQIIRDFPVKRMMFTSSATVYGTGCIAPFQENGALGEPASPYGITKRSAELHCLLFHKIYQIPVTILRPFSVFGPRLRPDLAISIFASAIINQQTLPILGDGTAKRDFTYIDDFINGVITAWKTKECIGEIINLGHNQPRQIREVIDILADQLGQPARLEYRPPHPGDLPLTCADLNKAQSLFDYRPKVSLEEGLEHFARWFCDQSLTDNSKMEST